MSTRVEATVEDLYVVEGKAEIVNGEILQMSPTGDAPNYAASEIFVSLHAYAKRTGAGRAVSDNAAFLCNLPDRKSFSPDAAFYTGRAGGMKFFPDMPVFAVEVRSEGDYGARAEREIKRKCAEYFAAGTLIVWDVDLLNDDVIKSYAQDAPNKPRVFRRGEIADAEPAVAGWAMTVDDLFAS